ncbi:cupredoxin domain-containing protein [Candidatus Nitrosocosmicus sp. T]
MVSTRNSIFITGLFLFSALLFLQSVSGSSIASAQIDTNNNSTTVNNNQSTFVAEDLFNTKTMTLGSNVKHLVILVPNEGHHAEGEDNEARFLDQHFVPENAVINTGTTVSWFNGDVGHERTINVLNTDGTSLFNTGEIQDSQMSASHTFTNPGTYNYEAEGDPGVTMEGTITIVDNSSSTTTPSLGNFDTVGVFMAPTQDIDTYLSEITNAGITVESTHDFEDLRGGQKGTGDIQTLIIWSTSGKDLTETISALSEISLDLPYS